MYDSLLFIHSWFRWAVYLAVIYFLIRSIIGWQKKSPWTVQDNHFVWAFTQVFAYQIGFGLTLWIGLSPLTKIAIKDPALLWEEGLISFWVLRHPATMVLALGVYFIGKSRSEKALSNRFKAYAITFTVIFLMITSAIPWPWLAYGRALFRWFF